MLRVLHELNTPSIIGSRVKDVGLRWEVTSAATLLSLPQQTDLETVQSQVEGGVWPLVPSPGGIGRESVDPRRGWSHII